MDKFIEVVTENGMCLVKIDHIFYIEKWNDSTTVIHLEGDIRLNVDQSYEDIKKLLVE